MKKISNPLFRLGKPKPRDLPSDSSSESDLWSSSVIISSEEEDEKKHEEEERVKRNLKKKKEERFLLWRRKQNLKKKLRELKKQEAKFNGENEPDAFSCRLMGEIIIMRRMVDDIFNCVDNMRNFLIAEKAVYNLKNQSENDMNLNLDMNKVD
jgi:hypothetical protein